MSFHAILVPGGFGRTRAPEGKIKAAQFAAKKVWPTFGICLACPNGRD